EERSDEGSAFGRSIAASRSLASLRMTFMCKAGQRLTVRRGAHSLNFYNRSIPLEATMSIRFRFFVAALTLAALTAPRAELLAQGGGAAAPTPPVTVGSKTIYGRCTATLCPGVKIGNMLFVSGQLGGRDSTIGGQTTQA